MPYRVRGTVDATSRVLLFNESDMSLERSNIFEAGDWELVANNLALKMVIARETTSGEAYGFGGITPETYEDPDSLLLINTLGDWLAIDSTGNGLIVSPA
jgi:hypothetical protein